jgi:hypothetical protein
MENRSATFANQDVLKFYKEMPFSYFDSAENQAQSIKQRDEVKSYADLVSLLTKQLRIIIMGVT